MFMQSKNTLDHSVYQKLKEMIINHELKTDEVIIQSQLSEQLGVSRTPLRKALGELEKEGLLESTAKGWYVKEFNQKDMVSIFQIRSVLEGLACRLATDRVSKPDLAFLRAMFIEAYEKVDEHQAEDYYQADLAFHNKIIELAKDPWLEKVISSTQIIRTSLTQGLYREPAETFHEHLAIIDAMEAKDALLAEKLMQQHTNRTVGVIKQGNFNIYK